MRLFQAESFKKGIVSSILFNGIAKVTAIINLFAIAYYFGTGSSSDIYFFLINAMQLLVTLIAAINASVLIPEAMRLRSQENEKKSMYFLNYFMLLYVILGLVIIACISISPLKFFSLFSDFKSHLLLQNISLLYGSLFLFLVMVLCSLLTSILASYRYFTTPMIVSAINNLFAITLLVILHKKLGIISVLYGLLAGYLLNLYILIHYMRKSLRWKFKVVRYKLNTQIKKNLLFSQIGSVCSFLFNYVSLYLLSGLGTGVISSVNYGQRLAALPTQFITTQFSAVSGIKMNEEYAGGRLENLNRLFLQGVKLLLFILTPLAVFVFFYSKEITILVFRRGAFNHTSVNSTQFFLKYLILIVPFVGIDTFFARLFMATQKIAVSAINQIVISVVQLGLIFVLIKYLGDIGYAYAMVIGYGLSIILIYFFIFRYFPKIDYKEVLFYFLKVFLINGIIGYGIYMATSFFQLSSLEMLLIGGLLFLSLLLPICYFFKLDEGGRAALINLYRHFTWRKI